MKNWSYSIFIRIFDSPPINNSHICSIPIGTFFRSLSSLVGKVVKITVRAGSNWVWNCLPLLRVGPLYLTGLVSYGSWFHDSMNQPETVPKWVGSRFGRFNMWTVHFLSFFKQKINYTIVYNNLINLSLWAVVVNTKEWFDWLVTISCWCEQWLN